MLALLHRGELAAKPKVEDTRKNMRMYLELAFLDHSSNEPDSDLRVNRRNVITKNLDESLKNKVGILCGLVESSILSSLDPSSSGLVFR